MAVAVLRACARVFARIGRRIWKKEEKRYDRSTRCTGGGGDAGGDAGGLRRGRRPLLRLRRRRAPAFRIIRIVREGRAVVIKQPDTNGTDTGSAKDDLNGGHNESGRADEDGQMDGTVETRRYDRALAASLSQLILNRIGE